MGVKDRLEDFQKSPVVFLVVIAISSGMTVYMTQSFATMSFVNEQIKSLRYEIKEENKQRDEAYREDLKELKTSIKELNTSFINLYREIKNK